jgi:hypothetical protein
MLQRNVKQQTILQKTTVDTTSIEKDKEFGTMTARGRLKTRRSCEHLSSEAERSCPRAKRVQNHLWEALDLGQTEHQCVNSWTIVAVVSCEQPQSEGNYKTWG